MDIKNVDNLTYNPINNDTNDFSTHDLELATALICTGFQVDDVLIKNSRAIFYFKNHVEISNAIEAFWNNTLQVSPLLYANSRKNLKSRIHSMS